MGGDLLPIAIALGCLAFVFFLLCVGSFLYSRCSHNSVQPGGGAGCLTNEDFPASSTTDALVAAEKETVPPSVPLNVV